MKSGLEVHGYLGKTKSPTKIILDTGADKSYITKYLVIENKLKTEEQKPSLIEMANGKKR